jgi:hypothetical protein
MRFAAVSVILLHCGKEFYFLAIFLPESLLEVALSVLQLAVYYILKFDLPFK